MSPFTVGIGLRFPHLQEIERNPPEVDWFEVLVDNIVGDTPAFYDRLLNIRAQYPFAFHSVSFNLGSCKPKEDGVLDNVRELITLFKPTFVSDHLAWTGFDGRHHHDLLPLPYNEESLEVVAQNILRCQDTLGCSILIENPSAYLCVAPSPIPEWEFLNLLCEKTSCGILLDVNNIYVTANNLRTFSPEQYLSGIKKESVGYLHLAGFDKEPGHLLDSHGCRVWPEVWELYHLTLEALGPKPCLIEWDEDLPPLATLVDEAHKAKEVGRAFS